MRTERPCIPRDNAIGQTGGGDFLIDPAGRISRGPGHVYGGVQIIKTEGLHDIAEPAFSLNLLWNKMGQSQRLFGLEYPGTWCDVGHPGGITLAENMLNDANV